MRLLRTFALAGLLLLTALAARADLQHFDTSSVTIDTARGAQRFTVEMAITPAQQQQGLMYRRTMAADAGMLFVMKEVGPATFWMKNTLLPLDMLFIGADGKIVDIRERAVPMSQTQIVSKAPARAVLELNGGTVARLGIKIGDVVHHATFANAGS
jgi:uncharacterized protein